jgi:hypothetical protein
MPDVDSLEELNDIIEAAAAEDDRRHIGGRFLTVADHFAVEADHLLSPPAEPFDTRLLLSCRVEPKSAGAARGCPASPASRRSPPRSRCHRPNIGDDGHDRVEGEVDVPRWSRPFGRGAAGGELDFLELLGDLGGELGGQSGQLAIACEGNVSSLVSATGVTSSTGAGPHWRHERVNLRLTAPLGWGGPLSRQDVMSRA